MCKRHILVCESGWRGIRELSLELAGKNKPSTVLIKGLVQKQVKRMITKYAQIHNVFIPAKIFTPFLFVYISIALVIAPGKKISIFLSKEKTYGRLSVFKQLFSRIKLTKVYDTE